MIPSIIGKNKRIARPTRPPSPALAHRGAISAAPAYNGLNGRGEGLPGLHSGRVYVNSDPGRGPGRLGYEGVSPLGGDRFAGGRGGAPVDLFDCGLNLARGRRLDFGQAVQKVAQISQAALSFP